MPLIAEAEILQVGWRKEYNEILINHSETETST